MPGSHHGDLFGASAQASTPPANRRKSLWKSSDASRRHAPTPTPTPFSTPTAQRSASPRVRERRRKESGFLGALFPKRKSASAAGSASHYHPPQPPPQTGLPPPATLRRGRSTAPTPEAIARGVEILRGIFPKWDAEPLQALLEFNGYIMEETISAILRMEADDAAAAAPANEGGDGDAALSFPIKNPLPDDFLRDEQGVECSDDDDEDDDDAESSAVAGSQDNDDEDEDDDNDEAVEGKRAAAGAGAVDDNVSEQSGSLAEDDGTLYGKEFSVDGDDDLKDDDALPPVVFNGVASLRSNKLVADSMNQKFLPEELRHNEPASILDTAHIDVIKRSKLNLSEAENRIRHREPHLVFELLSKASEIYRNGLISSHELDLLRSMVVKRIQPSKMLTDMTMSMDGIISDHEWHLLILKAKGIRQGLSIRVINDDFRAARSNTHMEYMIRVVDIESGVVWFTRKRFREFYKLHRKLSRLSGRINACEFPTRRSGRNSANSLASDRAPILEAFLRTTAALVTPSPLTFLHGVALKQLQQFLDVPHVGLLERNRTQAVPRELRVFVYHTVHDATSPEGKACAKFLAKIRAGGGADPGSNLLEEIGDILDGVQEYMLEHRFDEMSTHIQRLLVFYSAGGGSESAHSVGGRSSSFVSLAGGDALSSNDKRQQLISDAIRHELEERVCVPLMLSLTASLRAKVAPKESQFRQQVFQLRGKPQSYFGIPIDKISLSSWRSVVDTIKEMDDAFLPLDKMRKLVATAHAIHTLHRAERQMFHASRPPGHVRRHSISFATTPPASAPGARDPDAAAAEQQAGEREPSVHAYEDADAGRASREEHEDVLSGDDFLPIFVYVIVHSDLASPILTQVLLNRLCDPEKRRSESGYYLATFEAALHYILSHDALDATAHEEY
ncbi:hypothetical protein PybrP1_013120 [[Pythium] brassicae (nom. inval.)]|nr:hypothetical protein PybrP1_013120 [[Pythium] brassicae (nom. inval.)]